MRNSADIGRRWQLSEEEQRVLDGPVVDALTALPVRVKPTDVPTEKGRLADLIRAQFSA